VEVIVKGGYAMAQAVRCLLLRRTRFLPRLVDVGTVVDKVALGQVVAAVLRHITPST
jgi:hypothetical protein